jgi:tRNA(Ile2) C34 agmatinyltransferase TiaS
MPAVLGLVTVGGFVVACWFSLRRVRPFIADVPKGAAAVSLAGGIVLYSGSLILLGLRRRRRDVIAARLRAGLCPRCGYDLRVNNGRCPECGATVPAKPDSEVP